MKVWDDDTFVLAESLGGEEEGVLDGLFRTIDAAIDCMVEAVDLQSQLDGSETDDDMIILEGLLYKLSSTSAFDEPAEIDAQELKRRAEPVSGAS